MDVFDDLKLYPSSERQQGIKLALTHQMMDNMGLTVAAKKTKTITMVRGKCVEKDEGLQLADDVVIEDLGDNLYNFLGVDEAEQQKNKVVLKKAETEVIGRVSVILDTPMPDHNKISAINIFALPVLTYFLPVIYFSLEDLNEIGLKIKRLLTERGTRHPQHLNTLLYAARSLGGRGLNQISTTYKETKIKAAIRLATSDDPKLQAVRQFQVIKEKKGRRSILKDARKYAIDMELQFEMGDDPMLSLRSVEDRTYTATDVKGAKNVLSRGGMVQVKKDIKQSTWQGNITTHRMEDENVELPECFNWSVKWRSAPTYTICAINEIVQQLSRTRVREEMMGKTTDSTHAEYATSSLKQWNTFWQAVQD